MGGAAAYDALEFLARNHSVPDRVISSGFCGSLEETCPLLKIVQATQILSENRSWSCSAQSAYIGLPVRLVSTEVPVLSREARIVLQARSNAQVVDMESAAVADWCSKRSVPMDAIRVVTDDLSHPLPIELPWFTEGGSIRLARLLLAAFRRPLLISELRHLATISSQGAHMLADTICRQLNAHTGEGFETGSGIRK